MPGHLTHKVITLEPYLGVGSFYLALPNIIRTLSRWITYTPNWALPRSAAYRQAFYPRVLETAEREIAKIATRSAAFQKQWGLDFLARSLAYWCRYNDPEQVENLMVIDATRSFLKSLSKTLPGSVPRRLVA